METDFMGKEGFIWAVGVVEDRFDKLFLGRCRVRWLGWHTKNKQDLPTSSLPWAFPMMPITSASQTGVGTSPTGPVEGTWVFGFFRDGKEANDPVMIGTLGGRPDKPCNPDEGFNDPRDYNDATFYDVDPATGELVHLSDNVQNVPQHPLNVVRDFETGSVKIKERSDKPTIEAGQQTAEDHHGNAAVKAEFLRESTVHTDERVPDYEYSYNYPLKRFLGEPTTPRLARGMEDGSTKIKFTMGSNASGALVVKREGDNNSIVQRKYALQMKGYPLAKGNRDGSLVELNEPNPAYSDSVKYPYNHVHVSESGHTIEIDDSPMAERLHWYHRSGSYREMHPGGSVVDKSNEDYWSCVLRNSHEMVGGSKFASIKGGYELVVNTEGSDDDFYLKVKGMGGDVRLDSEQGNIEMYTKNGIAFINAKRIEFNASQEVVINTPLYNQTGGFKEQPTLHGGPQEQRTMHPGTGLQGNVGTQIERKGDFFEIIGGEKSVNSGRISYSSMGAFGISAQGMTTTISHSSEENITGHGTSTPPRPGKSIVTTEGHINLKSGGATTGSGGIVLQLNDNPYGVKKSPSAATGYFQILPSSGNPTASDITLSSSLGDIKIMNKVAEFSMSKGPQGNIVVASHGAGGTAEFKTKLAGLSITNSGTMSIKNDVASLKKIIEALIDDYLQHSHPVTGAVAPTGGPLFPGAAALPFGGVPAPPIHFYPPTKANKAKIDLNALFSE